MCVDHGSTATCNNRNIVITRNDDMLFSSKGTLEDLPEAEYFDKSIVKRNGGHTNDVWLTPVGNDAGLRDLLKDLLSVALHEDRKLATALLRIRGSEHLVGFAVGVYLAKYVVEKSGKLFTLLAEVAHSSLLKDMQ